MELNYKKAVLEDIEILTETRITVLRAANQLSDDVEMSNVKEQSYLYYQKALSEDSHVAYLVFDGNEFVGAGGISFFHVMPTFHNPTGKKAYETRQKVFRSMQVVMFGSMLMKLANELLLQIRYNSIWLCYGTLRCP